MVKGSVRKEVEMELTPIWESSTIGVKCDVSFSSVEYKRGKETFVVPWKMEP